MTAISVYALLVLLGDATPQDQASPAVQGGQPASKATSPDLTEPIITANELYKIANQNAAAFDVKFKGKRIRLKGRLARVEGQDSSDGKRTYLAWLVTANWAKPRVACRFTDPKPLADLKSGDQLLIEGVVHRHHVLVVADGRMAGGLGEPFGAALGGGQFGGGIGGQFGGGFGGGQFGGGFGGGQFGGGFGGSGFSGFGPSQVGSSFGSGFIADERHWEAREYVEVRACKILAVSGQERK
jgi:hypothetical protein